MATADTQTTPSQTGELDRQRQRVAKEYASIQRRFFFA
jgi:hypothetical protein